MEECVFVCVCVCCVTNKKVLVFLFMPGKLAQQVVFTLSSLPFENCRSLISDISSISGLPWVSSTPWSPSVSPFPRALHTHTHTDTKKWRWLASGRFRVSQQQLYTHESQMWFCVFDNELKMMASWSFFHYKFGKLGWLVVVSVIC